PVSRRAERDRAAVPVRLLQLRVEGGPPVGEPLRHGGRGAGAAERARPPHLVGRRAADLVPRVVVLCTLRAEARWRGRAAPPDVLSASSSVLRRRFPRTGPNSGGQPCGETVGLCGS